MLERTWGEPGENWLIKSTNFGRLSKWIHLPLANTRKKVKSMNSEAYYQNILMNYSSTISKELLRKICHISKRKAQYLLEHGVIPCKNNGKATHKYAIAIADVVTFLRQKDAHPDLFSVPSMKLNGPNKSSRDIPLSPEATETMQQLYVALLEPYPDLLSVQTVCEVTGYSQDTVNRWCNKRYIFRFQIRKSYRIPKASLIEFMMSPRFHNIGTKSQRHLWLLAQVWSKVSQLMLSSNSL